MKKASIIISLIVIAAIGASMAFVITKDETNVIDETITDINDESTNKQKEEDVEIVSDTYLSGSIDAGLLNPGIQNNTGVNNSVGGENIGDSQGNTENTGETNYRPNWRYEGDINAPQPFDGEVLFGTEADEDAELIIVSGNEEERNNANNTDNTNGNNTEGNTNTEAPEDAEEYDPFKWLDNGNNNDISNKFEGVDRDKTLDYFGMPLTLSDFIDELLDIINSDEITKHVVNYSDGKFNSTETFSETAVFYALRNNDKYKKLGVADTLIVYDATKISDTVINVLISNNYVEKDTYQFVKHNGAWKLNMNDALTEVKFRVPTGVTPEFNGIKLDNKNKMQSLSGENGDVYKVSNVLIGSYNDIAYDNSLGNEYRVRGNVYADKDGEIQDARYRLIDSDIEVLIPYIDKLWKDMRDAASKLDKSKMSKLIYSNEVSADELINSLSKCTDASKFTGFTTWGTNGATSNISESTQLKHNVYKVYVKANFKVDGEQKSIDCFVDVYFDGTTCKFINGSDIIWKSPVE